jgi:preprotein translocase subunit SecG
MPFINKNRSSQGRLFSIAWISIKINSLPRVTDLFCAVFFVLFLCVLFLNVYSDCDVDVSTDFDMLEARRV